MASKSIVILGGGVGGLVVASLLGGRLHGQAEITLVDRKPAFQFPPSYPWLMTGRRRPEEVQRPLRLLESRGIRVVTGAVSRIDLGDQQVEVGDSRLAYDKLVIALGADYAPELIPGLARFSHHIYDLDSAIRLRDALAAFEGGVVAVGVSRLPFKCPAAPYETTLLLDHELRRRGLQGRFSIRFFTPEGMPLPSAGPVIGGKAMDFLASRGVQSTFKTRLTEVRQGEAGFEDGSTVSFDLMIAVPPHVCPPVVAQAGLTDATGWVPVDPSTMRTRFTNVYAIGDVASIATPAGFVPYLPKAGVFAHGQAEVVANNLSVEIRGRGRAKAWDGGGACFLMTGGSQAALVKGNWFTTPHPTVSFSPPSRTSYMQRVLFEKYWMSHWL